MVLLCLRTGKLLRAGFSQKIFPEGFLAECSSKMLFVVLLDEHFHK